jgi:hypothetical protein
MNFFDTDFFLPSYKDLCYQGHFYLFRQHNKLNLLGKKINEETGDIAKTLYLQPKSLMHDQLAMLYPGEPLFYSEKIILPIYVLNVKNINTFRRNKRRKQYLDLNIEYINFDYQDTDKTNGIVYIKPIERFGGYFLQYNPSTSVQYKDNQCCVVYKECEDLDRRKNKMDVYNLPLSINSITPTVVDFDV